MALKAYMDISIFYYKVRTTSLEGSVSTPFFQQPFNENSFKPILSLNLHIYVPESIKKKRTNMSIVINVEYDIAEFSTIEYVSIAGKNFENTEKKAKASRTYIVREDFYRVLYTRRIEIKGWKNRRNTGMKVNWYYTDNNGDTENNYLDDKYSKYLDDNREFTWLANIIHEKGPQLGNKLLKLSTSVIKFGEKCKNGMKQSDEKFSNLAEYTNVSNKVNNDVSDETLELAFKIYFSLVFCPDNLDPTVEFYQNLFENFPVEAILKTLARLVYVAREKKLAEHYTIAMFFFNEITATLSLTNKDIAVMTTSFTELQEYEDLKSHQVGSEELLRDSSEVERLISHPVHIEDSRESPSAFIPFCSLGGDLTILGRKSPHFTVPVCAAFREKIVGGQLCYQAQLHRYGRGGWKETLQKGLSLVIDTNQEYDVRNLLTRNTNKQIMDPKTFEAYPQSNEQDSFSILLETISKPFYC